MPTDSDSGSSAMPMRKLIIIAAITACLAGAILQSQGVVRIRVSSPSGPQQPEQPGRQAKTSDVEPIDPTPEQGAQVEDLIEQLGASRLVVRDRAMSDLAQFGAVALGQVRNALRHDDDEIVWRCALLEEVILSGQGELFLSARTLGLSISELNAHLAAEDIIPLLHVLRARAEPGMPALWARIFERSANNPRLYLAARLCREVEGGQGYGRALARTAWKVEGASLLSAAVLLQPGEAADAVELLTQVRYSAGDDLLLGQVLEAARDLRGAYPAPEALAARAGRPLPNTQDTPDAAAFRQALALMLAGPCSAEELEQAGLPPAAEMPPLMLAAWMDLLARSSLHERARDGLLSLLQGGVDDRRAAVAAGRYAEAASPDDAISLFDNLPLAAQLAVLDSWWLNPRAPATVQPFLIGLLDSKQEALARVAAAMLAQYRAGSTAGALLQAAGREAIAVQALQSLRPMADLLAAESLLELLDSYPAAAATVKPMIAAVLAASGNEAVRDALINHWRGDLPRAELDIAMKLLGRDPASPAGAWQAARSAEANAPLSGNVRMSTQRLSDHAAARDLVLLRALISLETEQGFQLIENIAATPDDPNRLLAMAALALAGRDSHLVADWLRRFNGEVPDPQQALIGWPLALSATPEAARLRLQTLQQGMSSPNLQWLLYSFRQDRCPEIDVQQLLATLLETPEGARAHWALAVTRAEGVSARAARNVANLILFGRDGMIPGPAQALWLEQSGIDVLDVLYNSTEGTPRSAGQLISTALLGEADRAREIIARVEADDDGSLWAASRRARAWLGMLDEPENARLAAAFTADPSRVPGAVRAARAANAGDAAALRSLLDALGPDARRFEHASSAAASLSDSRWGAASVSLQGAARTWTGAAAAPRLPAAIVRAWLPAAPEEWAEWWKCRRALLHWDGFEYQFLELP